MAATRRTVLKGMGLGALAIGSPISLTSCAAPAAAAWFATMTAGVAATLLAETIEDAFTEGWEAWKEPTQATMNAQALAGWGYHSFEVYGHEKPGASMFSCSHSSTSDPATDRLALAFRAGNYITLESWSWRAVASFIEEETEDREDDELLHQRQLLAATVLPHGVAVDRGSTRNGSASWLTYPARDGDVEIVSSRVADGSDTVTVTATGYFSGQPGNPTVRTYELD